jgi:hypothetical protein
LDRLSTGRFRYGTDGGNQADSCRHPETVMPIPHDVLLL